MGLDIYLYTAAEQAEYDYTHVEGVPSNNYPDHLFNRRYLRSSYNSGGFNRAVPDLLGEDRGLDWIFQSIRLDDQYDIELTSASIDGLREAKARALEVARQLSQSDRLRVMTVSPNMFSKPPEHDDEAALRMYRVAVAGGRVKPDDWWMSSEMHVFGDGLSVLAAISGRAPFNVPGVHLVYRAKDNVLESYVQSAEIVAEFCDEAIGLIERDGSCHIHWSG